MHYLAGHRDCRATVSVSAQFSIVAHIVTSVSSAVSQTLPAVASFSVPISKAAGSPLDHLPVVVLTDGSLLIACL